ncbi:MAG TPA: extracellular solute-binding protein, partial [Chloroflexota bacterium]|nr:extracellular solute-binding protein [Chloroflexota bacterium]
MAPRWESRRRLLKGLVTGLAGAVAVSCRGQAGPVPQAARAPATLVYAYDHTDLPQTVGAWYRWMAGRFADEFPGSKAEVQLVSKLPELITVSVAGGKPAADAIYLRLFEARELWDAGVLTELTASIRQHKELAPSNYFPSANDYRTSGGKQFALPNYVNTEMIWVNCRLLQEAGLDPRAADLKTWADLARYNQVLTKRDSAGKYVQLGHPMNAVAWQGFSAYIYANGGEIQDAEVTRARFNHAQTEQALTFWREMYQRYGNPALWAENLQQAGTDKFQTEQWAIRDRSFGFARASRATPDYFPSRTDSWLVPVPLGPSNKGPAATMWVNQMGVPKGGAHPDQAFELLRCAVDVKGQTVMHQLAQWEPSMPAYYQTQAFRDELKKDPLLQVGLDSFRVGRTFPFYRRFSVISGEPYAPIVAAIRGERDVRSALEEAERLTNQ